MVVVKLPDIMFGSIKFENIFSIRVLEWLVILNCCKIEARESINYLSGYIYYNFWQMPT